METLKIACEIASLISFLIANFAFYAKQYNWSAFFMGMSIWTQLVVL